MCSWIFDSKLFSLSFSSLSDPRCHHRVIPGWGVHRHAGSSWDAPEVHRTSDHHPHCGPHWLVWFPGCGRESWEALGNCYAVSTDGHLFKKRLSGFCASLMEACFCHWEDKKGFPFACFHDSNSVLVQQVKAARITTRPRMRAMCWFPVPCELYSWTLLE